MTQTPSSSNRGGGVCDAVVVKDQRESGPLRLPETRAEDFIDHFNRTYQGVGMSLAPVEAEDDQSDTVVATTAPTIEAEKPKKIPGSSQAAGDDDLS